MKAFDLKSSLVAGAIGAVLLALVINLFDTDNNNRTNSGFYAFLGFILGVGVQAGVRITGVS